MKILLVNSHHKPNGGTEKYYFELGNLLKKRGHSIAFFSMKDYGNKKTIWSRYFVSNINPNHSGLQEIFKKLPRIWWSREASYKMGKILDDFKPDLVHLNNIYYFISPSILMQIRKRNIPVVQTVHDYQMISPNVIMHHGHKNCEIFKTKKYYKSIFHKCIGNSFIGSFLAVTGLYIQNFNNFYTRSIDVFIAPSKFMRDKLSEYNIPIHKIVHIPNFINNNIYKFNRVGGYIFYYGRLTSAKGLYLIIKLATEMPDVNILVAGNFDSKEDKIYFHKKIRTEKINNLKYLGFKKKSEVLRLIKESKFVVVPSIWNENQPYSILESSSLGKPVIASRVGGVSEIVKNNKSGILFNPKNFKDFKNKVNKLLSSPKTIQRMGKFGAEYIKTHFSPEEHYKKLITVYKSLT